MAGLEDIGEAIWTLKVGSKEISGGGLSAHDILYLMRRFPLVGQMFGVALDAEALKGQLEAPNLMGAIPEAACAAFALATGAEPGDKKAEKIASRIPLIHQIRILRQIINATIGEEGVGPFVEELNALNATISPPGQSDQQASTSQASGPPAFTMELPTRKPGRLRRVG